MSSDDCYLTGNHVFTRSDTPDNCDNCGEERDKGDIVSDEYDPDAILADPNSLPIHRMYAHINIGVRDRGEVWEKCANCGDPYMHTEEWSASTVCSQRCFDEFRSSLL